MIEVKNVHKKFDRNEVLKGVTLKVETGDVIVIPVSYTHLDVYKRQAEKRQIVQKIYRSKQKQLPRSRLLSRQKRKEIQQP